MNEEVRMPADILVVEDNPLDVRLIKEALADERRGNNISVVRDGKEALAFLRGEGKYANAARPDIILLDWFLPKKHGREVLAEIRADSELSLIPVIVLTTSDADQDIRAAYDLHANCFVTKPLSPEKFIAVVQSVGELWLSLATLPPRQ